MNCLPYQFQTQLFYAKKEKSSLVIFFPFAVLGIEPRALHMFRQVALPLTYVPRPQP
jgi:hypothetical protein